MVAELKPQTLPLNHVACPCGGRLVWPSGSAHDYLMEPCKLCGGTGRILGSEKMAEILKMPQIKADHKWRLCKIRDEMRSAKDAAEIQWALNRIEELERHLSDRIAASER